MYGPTDPRNAAHTETDEPMTAPAFRSHRITFLSTMANSPWGGSENLWLETAIALLRDGHSVSVNVCRWPTEPPEITRLRAAGAQVERRFGAKLGKAPVVLRRLAELWARATGPAALRRWITHVDPDLIVISNGCFDDNLHLSRACAAMGVPYVLIAHANGECMWPDDASGSEVAKLYSRATRAFFVAEKNRALLEDQLGVEFDNAEVVRNPHRAPIGRTLPWPAETGELRLACVGRLHPPSKGQDLLLRALAKEQWRNRGVTISLFGEGPNRESLMRLAHRLGIAERVFFRGHSNDIAEVWRTHHAIALPSRYEGTPISLIEAMLFGRPSIVTDVGGNAEMVEDGITGFVAPSATERDLDTALERAWAQRAHWPEMGQQGAAKLRSLLPPDPARQFAIRLLELARQRPGSAPSRAPSADLTNGQSASPFPGKPPRHSQRPKLEEPAHDRPTHQ